MVDERPKQVVIVGGGFGGLYAAKGLCRAPAQVTLVDRKNHHTFQPLLYQVATAGLSPADIAAPIRTVLKRCGNTRVLLGNVVGFDLDRRRVLLEEGSQLDYDYLVVAAGARHSYFGHTEWEPIAPGLKTIEDALEIRRRLFLAFELAEREAASGRPYERLTFTIVGGGPTGVELAGTLAEITHTVLPRDFRSIDPTRTRILLVEAGPRVLPTYAEDLSRSAEEQLRALGVEVMTSAMVKDVKPGAIRIGDTWMPSAVTLWAAGVAASSLGAQLSAEVDRAGRVPVERDCTLPGHPEVFVIGDMAAFRDDDGQLLPGLSAVAQQQGKYVGKTIARELQGRAREPFRYVNKGILATIGRAAAVAEFGRIHISGFIAWLAWLFIHIMLLIGFRNRLAVMLQWAWAYFVYERSARLITGETELPGWPTVEMTEKQQITAKAQPR
jgi:NADH dehydrogenase